MGKTPDEVAQVIIEDVGDASKTGAVVVLVGLSGTGKGTTVRYLTPPRHCLGILSKCDNIGG